MFRDTMQEILDQLEAFGGNYFTLDFINDKSDNQMASITVSGNFQSDDLEKVVIMFEGYPEFAPTSTIKNGDKIVYYFKENRDPELDESDKSNLKYDGVSVLNPGDKIGIGRFGQIKLEVIEDLGDSIKLVNTAKNYKKDTFIKHKSEYKGNLLYAKLNEEDSTVNEVKLLSPSEFSKLNESLDKLFKGDETPGKLASYLEMAKSNAGEHNSYYQLLNYFRMNLPKDDYEGVDKDPEILEACENLIELLKNYTNK